MASTRLDCDRCGNKGFSTKAELASHQRSSYCWTGQQRKASHVSKKSKATAEGAAQGHTTIQDGALVHHNLLKNDEVVRPKEYRHSQDSTMLLAMINSDSTSEDWSTRRVVDWIRSCDNGKGLSEQDTNNILDALHHPEMRKMLLALKKSMKKS